MRNRSERSKIKDHLQLASNLRVLKVVLPVETLDAGLCLVGTVMQIVSLLVSYVKQQCRINSYVGVN